MTDHDTERARLYGAARISPDSAVTAGSRGTWRVVITVGALGIQSGGYIRIQTDSDTDWGLPQILCPTGDDYLTVQAPSSASVVAVLKGKKTQQFIVTGQPLAEGDEVVVTFGDRSDGGGGSRAQTFQEERRSFDVCVSPDGREQVWLPDPPVLTIVGASAEQLVVIAPSQAVRGVPFSIALRAEDTWGNPDPDYRGTVNLTCAGIELPSSAVTFADDDAGVRIVDGCVATSAGTYRIRASDAVGPIVVESNPIVASDIEPELTLYWGDPHGGQVADAGKIESFFRYARDVARVDFVGYQRNDHSMTNDDYALQQSLEREFYAPGRFVPLPGFEWSPPTDVGGHHNVFFRHFGQPLRRSGHGDLEDWSDSHLNLPHITDVYRAYRNTDLIITPHVGGHHSNLAHHEPALEPALEITSDHGTFE